MHERGDKLSKNPARALTALNRESYIKLGKDLQWRGIAEGLS